MKKTFLTLLILLVALLSMSFLLFKFRVHVVNSSLSTSFSVPVRISALDFSKKLVTVENFTIYNPPNSTEEKAMSMGSIRIEAPFRRYFETNTVIESITIDDVYVDIEFYDQGETQMNWDPILSSSWTASETPVDADAPIVTIRRFTLSNVRITLHSPGQAPRNFTIQGPVTYKNLNSRRGIPATVVADMIVRITLKEVFTLEGLARFAGGLFNTVLSPLEKLFPHPNPYNDKNPTP